MSYLHLLTVISFHKYNPEWEIFVYVYDAISDIDNNDYNPRYKDYSGKDFYEELNKLDYVKILPLEFNRKNIHSILISDIWRREILYKNGGVYSDFDVLWLRPMEELSKISQYIGNPCDFEGTVSFYNLTHGFHNVSNLIFEKDSPFLDFLIKKSYDVSRPYGDQSFGTDLLNNYFPTWDSVVSQFPRMLAIPYDTFYPYSTFKMDSLFNYNDLSPLDSPNVMCIHWFNGNGFSKDYINKEDYSRDCSMTKILKKEGWL